MMTISKTEVNELLAIKYLAEITQIKEAIKLFSIKYNCQFTQFEDHIQKLSKESFEEWDDYIEWKANENHLQYLTLKLNKI